MFATKPRDEWVARLATGRHVCGAGADVPEVVEDAQVAARGQLVDAEHRWSAGSLPPVGPVLAGQGAPDGPYALRDAMARTWTTLLADAGLQRDEIEELRDEGVIA